VLPDLLNVESLNFVW